MYTQKARSRINSISQPRTQKKSVNFCDSVILRERITSNDAVARGHNGANKRGEGALLIARE